MSKYRLLRPIITLAFIAFFSVMTMALSKVIDGVTIHYEELPDGTIKVTGIQNDTEKQKHIDIDGNIYTVNGKGSVNPARIATSIIQDKQSSKYLWRRNKQPTTTPTPPQQEPVQSEQESATPPQQQSQAYTPAREGVSTPDRVSSTPAVTGKVGSYVDIINSDPFFGSEAVKAFVLTTDSLARAFDGSKNKEQFIKDNDINLFIEQAGQELESHRNNISQTAQQILWASNIPASQQSSSLEMIIEALNNRLSKRESSYNNLRSVVMTTDADRGATHDQEEEIINYIILILIVVLVVVLVIVAFNKKKNKKRGRSVQTKRSAAPQEPETPPTIVVRRKTTSVLKKQSLDDVVNNPAYMRINTADFVADSAVRTIYLKNKCIKDVYNLYADDLRQTDKPKEDGCMVLGRWVRDDATGTYDISMEEVVFPGDDAVFKEFELNFGGKIKMRVAERLRKLRKDTNLQYDLVCWIHSHPGLGVFFSNFDSSVQMQLKHPQHPNFLIAFVVDILTSSQETGIFTFRHDGTINSRKDLSSLHSLEDMYKWAIESEKETFSPDNYYNAMANAKIKLPACQGVELNNNSIIDLTQIVVAADSGIIGWAAGTSIDGSAGREFVVSNIVGEKDMNPAGIIGCLVNVNHVSLPTIQRLVAQEIANLKFVMVYSAKQMSLTTIPVVNGELLADEQFYSEVNIEELKIWTRRKR